MKNFYEQWTTSEIEKYVKEYYVLVLFSIEKNVAKLHIYGTLNQNQKNLLKTCITGKFGNKIFTEDLSIRINEYAEEWYENYVMLPKIRVLNSGRG